MGDVNRQSVTLEARQLNDTDELLLDLLHEGRITPALANKSITEVSRQYLNQRLKRLEEHEHVENLEGTGVYELVSDPREAEDA